MKTTEITRSESGLYSFTVEPENDYIDVQLVRDGRGEVYVYKSIGGLPPALVFIPSYMDSKSLVFRTEAVKGMAVTIESASRVTACKVIDGGGTVTDVTVDNDARLLLEDGGKTMTEDGYDLCLE